MRTSPAGQRSHGLSCTVSLPADSLFASMEPNFTWTPSCLPRGTDHSNVHSSFLPSMRTLGSAMPMVGSMVFDCPVVTAAGCLDVCTVALTLSGLKYMALSRGTLNRSDSHDVVPWESWMEAHPPCACCRVSPCR